MKPKRQREPEEDLRLFHFSTGRVRSFVVAHTIDEGRRIFAREVVAHMDDLRLRELGCLGRAVEYANGVPVEEYIFTVGLLLEEAILAWKQEVPP